MDQLILAARDVVEAWENHTEELDVVIRRLAEALGSRASNDAKRETSRLTAAATTPG